MASSPKAEYLYDGSPLAIGGDSFEIRIYDRRDGRRHAYFVAPGHELRTGNGDDNTRIGYRVFGSEAMFLGMMVQKELRGSGFGELMIRHFFDGNIEQDAAPCETGMIHKPLIALSLSRAGLTPASRDFEAEILPRSSYEDTHVPKIHVLSEAACADCVVDCTPTGGKFYEVVDPAEVRRAYPLGTDDMVVALHTRYVP
jgi:hypothetical protein